MTLLSISRDGSAMTFDRVELGDGVSVPGQYRAKWELPSKHVVEIVVAFERGVPVVNSITVERAEGLPSLSGTELRQIPIAHIVEEAARRLAMVTTLTADGGSFITFPAKGRRQAKADAQVRPAMRRRTITPDLLRDVARIYRSNPSEPTAAVRDAFEVSPATASRWVERAREDGFLGRAIPGKPGEIKEDGA